MFLRLCNCFTQKHPPHLANVAPDSVPYFTFKGLTFEAKTASVYDGDTISIIFVRNREYIKYRCRMLGYDSPEMKPLLSQPNRDDEIKAANLAKKRLIELLGVAKHGLIKVTCGDFDKYGRILITVWNGVNSKSVNDIMLEEGYGLPYDGKKKTAFGLIPPSVHK